MKRHELIALFLQSRIFQHWHWFEYHFSYYTRGQEHTFARAIVDACLDVEAHLPGFAREFVTRLSAVGGRDRERRDLEQLFQQLAELLVLRQVVTFDWPCAAEFSYEPTTAASKKNPEIIVKCGTDQIGIEVKAPGLLKHAEQRATNPVQLPSRAATREIAQRLAGGEDATMPRDNPVKDFLISADAKFAPFRAESPNFFGLLVIVWDDFIVEPISALLGPAAGLLTANSFARQPDGTPNTFPNVDAVILIRHLHILGRASGDHPYIERRHALDYGEDGAFPVKAYVKNPAGRDLPEYVIRCFQAYPPGPELGAEYVANDVIWWF